jgi:hypothetical protein
MLMPATHTMKRPMRGIIAAALTAIYLVISLSPLASLAMHSKAVAHAVTGECSGDCDICGCSPESRASNSCCCSRKRQQQAHIHEDEHNGTPDCCKKKPVDRKTVIVCGCPCGSGKQVALSVGGTSELLPFHFTEQSGISHTVTTFTIPDRRLTSRHGDPPDPPPKLISSC